MFLFFFFLIIFVDSEQKYISVPINNKIKSELNPTAGQTGWIVVCTGALQTDNICIGKIISTQNNTVTRTVNLSVSYLFLTF